MSLYLSLSNSLSLANFSIAKIIESLS
jgi:hypothetical protein